ncbi:phage antirepressor KilAC domain-containing protein [Komagataeibacter intermedius]|uniref:phage antirepressor KilAC domain-containing protein n=1 Tax=Komagataeibacter intermedius TaxID=66229 RepID=UPI003B42DCC7
MTTLNTLDTNKSSIMNLFKFEGQEVRVLDVNGAPWWVLSDVCAILEITNPTRAADRLDEDECTLHTVKGVDGKPRETNIINESGLWSLVLTSRKAAAKRFKKWVTAEVIPSIRKTGSYSAKPLVPQTYAEALLEAGRIAKERDALKVENKELAVKGAALDRISTATGTHGLYEAAKILQVGPKKFVMWLASNQWIYKRTGSKVWLARQEKINAGYLWHKVDTFTDANGEERTRDTVKVLPKGLEKLAKVVPGAHIDADYAAVLEAAMRPFAKKRETATM